MSDIDLERESEFAAPITSGRLVVPVRPVLDFFPLRSPARQKQTSALDFVQRAYDEGYRDIVIAAPTGVGKTGIGIDICMWAAQGPALDKTLPGKNGGYYLVTQKLLQDQLEDDFEKLARQFQHSGCSLKSASEYPCPDFTTCMLGGLKKSESDEHAVCSRRGDGGCTYQNQRSRFLSTPLSVTNYSYFFTERTYVGQFPQRKVLIADECHTVERQMLGFVDIVISEKSMRDWAKFVSIPKLDTLEQLADWIFEKLLPLLEDRIVFLKELALVNHSDSASSRDLARTENQYGRLKNAVEQFDTNPDNWVFWKERDEKNQLELIAKPLDASAYAKKLLISAAPLRIYMSAYPGPKDIFCRSLGLDQEKVAWKNLSSPFPKENRPIHMFFIGSMGLRNIETTTPSILNVCDKLMTKHAGEKGIIHCHSYKLGDALNDFLLKTKHAPRVRYPRKADDRSAMLDEHVESTVPTVLISPSMAEGFNMADDIARFQIIPKIPFPYLGDKQVAAKKDLDADWYTLQTVSTILQACGRIVRSEVDFGHTYILDSDFYRLYDENKDFFPKWFQEGFIWYNEIKPR